MVAKLSQLLKDLDIYISQHAIYISKLERALKKGENFEHKDCHSCKFGMLWDSEIVPVKHELPDEVRKLLNEIESIHCQFHEVAKEVKSEDDERLKEVKELSTQLFQKLLELRRLLK